jgi:large subunit ribosomal protein L4
MKLKIYNTDGNATKRSVSLDAEVFAVEPNDHAIWLDVRSIQAAGRQGTHKTKERGDVRGGGAKPWRQKGTGRARAGTIRSPLWHGGGRVFGPRPHKYSVGVNRQTKRLARRSALSYKAQGEAIRILENFSFDAPKTRDMAALIGALDLADRKVLVMTGSHDSNVYKSGRNLPKVNVVEAASVSTLDVLKADVLVIQEEGLEAITGLLRGSSGARAATEAVEMKNED